MANNTSKYSATLDILKSIKHINNMLQDEAFTGNKKTLFESGASIMYVLYYFNQALFDTITSGETLEEEQSKIDFYIHLYELAEKGRLEIFTKKEGE